MSVGDVLKLIVPVWIKDFQKNLTTRFQVVSFAAVFWMSRKLRDIQKTAAKETRFQARPPRPPDNRRCPWPIAEKIKQVLRELGNV